MPEQFTRGDDVDDLQQEADDDLERIVVPVRLAVPARVRPLPAVSWAPRTFTVVHGTEPLRVAGRDPRRARLTLYLPEPPDPSHRIYVGASQAGAQSLTEGIIPTRGQLLELKHTDDVWLFNNHAANDLDVCVIPEFWAD